MFDDTKLLLRESESGEGLAIPAGMYSPHRDFDFALASLPDGRMGLYQSVRGIIYDCDKREDEPDWDSWPECRGNFDWDSWGCGECGWGKKCHEETHHT